MKDENLILLGLVGVGGYLLYKKLNDTGAAITGAPAAFGGALYDAGAGAVKGVEDTLANTAKGVTDTIGGAAKAVVDTIVMPPVLNPPFPEYIQKEVAIARENKGLVTQATPKIAVIDSQAPQWKNDLAINLQTQKFGYIPSTNFDSGLLIPQILNNTKAVYTGGGIAPKVVDIRKTYEVSGVPYATFAQQTGQNLSAAALSSFLGSNTKLTAVSVAPSKSEAPTKSTATTGTTSSTASTNSGAHFDNNLKVWVDNKTAKIVGKKAVGVWK